MEEAQAAFDIEFDPLPAPVLEFPENVSQPIRAATIDLDAEASAATSLPPANRRAQAFSLWLRCSDFDARRWAAAAILRQAVEENPHTTLQVVLEPLGHVGTSDRSCFGKAPGIVLPDFQLSGPILQPASQPAFGRQAFGRVDAGETPRPAHRSVDRGDRRVCDAGLARRSAGPPPAPLWFVTEHFGSVASWFSWSYTARG